MKKTLLFSLMLLAFVLSTSAVTLAQEATPEATEKAAFDIQPVLVDYLHKLPDDFYGAKPENALKELSSDAKPFLIDVRESKELASNGYIAGAVPIPLRSLLDNLDKLPASDQPIIVYCGSGHRGSEATVVLHLLGYTNVRSIYNGFAGWKLAGLPIETAAIAEPQVSGAHPPEYDAALFDALKQFLTTMPDSFYAAPPTLVLQHLGNDPKPFLIDVRGEAELKTNGYIEGQTNIPLRTLLDDLTKLPVDKAQPIIVYCAIGHRGAMAMVVLRLLGYSDVTNIGGGFSNWVGNSLPIVKPA